MRLLEIWHFIRNNHIVIVIYLISPAIGYTSL